MAPGIDGFKCEEIDVMHILYEREKCHFKSRTFY